MKVPRCGIIKLMHVTADRMRFNARHSPVGPVLQRGTLDNDAQIIAYRVKLFEGF